MWPGGAFRPTPGRASHEMNRRTHFAHGCSAKKFYNITRTEARTLISFLPVFPDAGPCEREKLSNLAQVGWTQTGTRNGSPFESGRGLDETDDATATPLSRRRSKTRPTAANPCWQHNPKKTRCNSGLPRSRLVELARLQAKKQK